MRTGPEGLGRDDLSEAAHTRHLRRFDNEVRIECEESNQAHRDENNNQAKQMGWANDGRPLALENKFRWWSIAHLLAILALRTVCKVPS
jgi:hypothetical protein